MSEEPQEVKFPNLSFGTDGVRGVAHEIFSPLSVSALALAFAQIEDSKKSVPFVIARDTRISGDSIAHAFSASINSLGIDVIDLGVCSTPAAAYVIRSIGAIGAVVSASHNPYYDNGIKLYSLGGIKLDEVTEEKIQELCNGYIKKPLSMTWQTNDEEVDLKFGKTTDGTAALEDYLQNLYNTITVEGSGKTVVLDCANGAASNYAHLPFEKLGFKVIVNNNAPNGTNINPSNVLEELQESVIKNKAIMGFSFDGDADRVIAVDSSGNIHNGDHILFALVKLTKQTLAVCTVMSNGGVLEAFRESHVYVNLTNVGDKNVLSSCLESDIRFGAEQSGHVIDLDYLHGGDGLYIALLLTQLLLENDTDLTEVCSQIKLHEQKLINVKVPFYKHDELMKHPDVKQKIADANHLHSRVLVRPSGTEPLIRVLVESIDGELAEDIANDIVELIESI